MGEDNSALLGAMIITRLQLAAMSRVDIPEEKRRDFFMYVDEFQNFATDSFANILSEARKYRLSLVLAHQYIGQLVTATSTRVRDAVFGNVGTIISFRVGAADAEFLEKEFMPEFRAKRPRESFQGERVCKIDDRWRSIAAVFRDHASAAATTARFVSRRHHPQYAATVRHAAEGGGRTHRGGMGDNERRHHPGKSGAAHRAAPWPSAAAVLAHTGTETPL